MTGPVLLQTRWLRHRIDVCSVLTENEVLWIARDVLEALGQEPGDFADEPGHQPLVAAEHIHASAYPLETIEGLFINSVLGEALIQWMREQENTLAAMGHGNVVRIASSPALIDGPLYSIARAAQILTLDPAISIEQHYLFEWLLAFAWVTKRGEEYRPARSAIDSAYLAVVPRRLPSPENPHPQVVMTTAGLVRIHQLLGGTDPTVLEQEPA